MTTSGTATFTLDFDAMMAVATAYVGGEDSTGFEYKQMQRIVNLMMADMTTRGVNMWAMDRQYITPIVGVPRYQLPADTIDVLETVGRIYNQSPTRLVSTLTNPFSTIAGSALVTVAAPQNGATLGDWVTFSPAVTVGGILIDGTYPIVATPNFDSYQIQGATIATATAVNQGGTITATYPGAIDIPMSRQARDGYQNMTQKFAQGRPYMYWVDRQIQPVLNLFPTPQAAQGQFDQIIYYRKRRLQDLSSNLQTLDLPIYMEPAMVWGMAYQLAMLRALPMERIGMLRQQYLEALKRAIEEDRDPSSFFQQPDLSHLFVSSR